VSERTEKDGRHCGGEILSCFEPREFSIIPFASASDGHPIPGYDLHV
jgi:hypothetical protein